MERLRYWWHEQQRRPASTGRVSVAFLVVGLVLAVGLAVLAVVSTGKDDPPADATPSVTVPATDLPETSPPSPNDGDGGTGRHAAALSAGITDALAQKSYPDLKPAVSRLGTDAWVSNAEASGCVDVTLANVDDCVAGPQGAPGLAVVLGDDSAIGYLPAVRAALGDRFRVQQITLRGCPVWDVPVDRANGAPFTACEQFRAAATAEIARLHPDLLFVSTSYAEGALLASHATGDAALNEIEAGYESALSALVPSARFAVVLQPAPGGAALPDCFVEGGDPADCATSPSTVYGALEPMELNVATATGALLVKTFPWFCDSAQECPSFVGRTPVYDDGLRVTQTYATSLGPVLGDALDQLAQDRPAGS